MNTHLAHRSEPGADRRTIASPSRGSSWCRLLIAIIVVLCSVLSILVRLPASASQPVVAESTPSQTVIAHESTIAPPSIPIHAILKPATVTPQPPSKLAPAAPIDLSAKAAYAVDLTNGVELYSVNADTPLAPASTTKIITAIVVAQHASLDATVTIQADDTVDPTIYSHMGLEVGDVVTVRDLLAGMLLNSGGDAALALARFVGATLPDAAGEEPRARFVNEMNREAAALGMKHSHFVDPDGRDTDGHVSTARDLALAAQRLFDFQTLESLVGERSQDVQIQGPNARTISLTNTNELLGAPGVHGVKTGTTDAAGQCLVLATWENGARVITVLLGSADRYGDANRLLNDLNQQFRWVRLGRNGDLTALNDELVQKGDTLGFVRTVVLSAQQAADLKYTLEMHPATGGGPFQVQGDVVFFIGAQPILRLAVYAGDPFKTGG
jgi:D-alanyl-D-alanine carboxypeptidase (penicillin-binding protein 5/6)